MSFIASTSTMCESIKHLHSKQILDIRILAILFTELCERLTFYSIFSNLVLFSNNEMQYTDTTASTISFLFSGVVFFVPVFAGWHADSITGRFNSIFLCGLIYIVGAAILPMLAFQYPGGKELSINAKRGFYMTSLAFIAIGTGGLKSNLIAFGAKQLEGHRDNQLPDFFNWFYWCINLGSAISNLVVVYIQQEINFFIGFIIPFLSICLSILSFYSCKNYYEHDTVGNYIFANLFRVPIEGLKRKRKSPYNFLSFLDYARLSNGGRFDDSRIDDVVKIYKLIPIYAHLIIFFAIHGQMTTTFFLQGSRMNLKIGAVNIPVASLILFNTIACLTVTPFMTKVIYPFIRKIRGRELSLLGRMSIGLLLLSIAMLTSGVVEIIRKQNIKYYGPVHQKVGKNYFKASHISILAQVPQFFIIGVGEIFGIISALEFAFSAAPAYCKSFVMGMLYLANGFGSFLGFAFVEVIKLKTFSTESWLREELNEGHYEYYCFALAGLGFLNYIIFQKTIKWYFHFK